LSATYNKSGKAQADFTGVTYPILPPTYNSFIDVVPPTVECNNPHFVHYLQLLINNIPTPLGVTTPILSTTYNKDACWCRNGLGVTTPILPTTYNGDGGACSIADGVTTPILPATYNWP